MKKKHSLLKASTLIGALLLLVGLFGLGMSIAYHLRGEYPLGSNSWIAGAGIALLIVTGAALTYHERYRTMEFQKKIGMWGIIFLLPWVLGFVMFFLVPLVRSLIFSFENVSIIPTGGLDETFVWFDNYRYILFEHVSFTQNLTKTVLEVILYTALIIIFSLLCAILLNGKFFGRSVARGIFFIPIVLATGLMIERVSNSSSMLMAQAQDDKVYGAAIISELMYSLGIGESIISYLAGAVNDIFKVVSLSGIQILIFLAALQGIPPQLYEVAKIEGATGYETFWKVTVVMVSPMILTCTLYTISDLFLRSELAETFQKVAFDQGRYGVSAAMSSFFLLTVLLVIGLYILPLRKAVFYYD